MHPHLHEATAHRRRSWSDIVNDAVRVAVAEDQQGLAAFDDRVFEPTLSYEALQVDPLPIGSEKLLGHGAGDDQRLVIVAVD
ncbi:MAG: hypothetical protein LAT65_08650 [Saccharospirillum sp.]|nr:hypothetical protein [Saccharospirillum sp.]